MSDSAPSPHEAGSTDDTPRSAARLEGHLLPLTVRTLEQIFNSIPDPVFVKDEQHRWVYLNDAYCQLMGYPREALLGKSDVDFFPPEQASVFWAKDEEVFADGRENINEENFTDSAGELHMIATKKSVFADDQGHRYIVGVIRDLTERTLMERALRESELRFKGLVDATFDGIAIHDQGVIIEANQALADMFGYSLEEMIGLNGLETAAPEYRPVILEKIRSGDSRPYEVEAIRKDGTRFSVEMVGKEVNYKGRSARVSAFRDITERKQLEQELRLQNERLRELDTLKSNFVGAVSHELRTPLTSIKGYAEFLEEGIAGPIAPEQLAFVERIMEGANRLERLVDDLLDFARLESGTFKLVRRPLDMAAIVEEVQRALTPQAREKQVTFEISCEPREIPIYADPGRLEQVLTNLVGNALKFTPAGGRIQVKARADDERVRIEVQDSGAGIAPEHLPHLFDRFYQADPGTTRKTGGTGLGLTISKALVDAHGGAIGVESHVGQGTTFWFTVPRGTAADLI